MPELLWLHRRANLLGGGSSGVCPTKSPAGTTPCCQEMVEFEDCQGLGSPHQVTLCSFGKRSEVRKNEGLLPFRVLAVRFLSQTLQSSSSLPGVTSRNLNCCSSELGSGDSGNPLLPAAQGHSVGQGWR